MPLALWYRGPLLHTGIKFAPLLSCVGRAWQGISLCLRLPTYAPSVGGGQRWLPAKAASLAPQGACDSSPGCSGDLCTLSYRMRDLPLILSPVLHAIVKQGPVCYWQMIVPAWHREALCRRYQQLLPIAETRSAWRADRRPATRAPRLLPRSWRPLSRLSCCLHHGSYVDNSTSTPYRLRETVAYTEGERYAASTAHPPARGLPTAPSVAFFQSPEPRMDRGLSAFPVKTRNFVR